MDNRKHNSRYSNQSKYGQHQNDYSKNRDNRFSSNVSDQKEQTLISYFEKNVLIMEQMDYDEFVENAKDYAKILKDGNMTTSKIRRVYAQIQRARDVKELKKLRPQFAYIAGRFREQKKVVAFMDLLDCLLKQMKSDGENDKEISNFKDFLEMIVAYMKYYGDRN